MYYIIIILYNTFAIPPIFYLYPLKNDFYDIVTK